ncbi:MULTISPECIES: RCC1 domain-containing protein [Chryseobacterium]|uniref:RCC1 domain-containing protein n=1 Tax=Chryseobacterium TaxID=59732 RepID=UPI00279668F0|nr:hypothetical protein [Chryseobacterium sp. CKR4-1]MDQ1805431.1 hypothetical protein [Chryseobacterium sp. CKR4-1]WBV58586.1 hypothetical protein PFY10_09015 [Chryseobacterium daecheongense]
MIKKISLIVIYFAQYLLIHAQVGIGTVSPKGILHLQNTDKELGIVIPRVSTAESVTGVTVSQPLEGTLVYDNSKNCLRVRNSATSWSDCLADENDVTPEIRLGRKGRKIGVVRDNAMVYINPIDNDAVYGLGANTGGQIPSSNSSNYSIPVIKNNSFKDVSMGQTYGLAVAKDGTLWGWGTNTYGRIGDGNTGNVFAPKVIPLPGGVLAERVTAGYFNALVLGVDKKLYVSGYYAYSVTGGGETADVRPFKKIAFFDDKEVVDMEVGMQQAVAVTSDGNIYVWGLNGGYVKRIGLPDGNVYLPTLLDTSSIFNSGEKVSQITMDNTTNGGGFITNQGRYFTFGYVYDYGIQGVTNTTPIEVTSELLAADEKFVGFDLDYYGVALITNKNRLFVAGRNTNGRLSTGGTTHLKTLTLADTSNIDGQMIDVAFGVSNMYIHVKDKNGNFKLYGAGSGSNNQLGKAGNSGNNPLLIDVLQ